MINSIKFKITDLFVVVKRINVQVYILVVDKYNCSIEFHYLVIDLIKIDTKYTFQFQFSHRLQTI